MTVLSTRDVSLKARTLCVSVWSERDHGASPNHQGAWEMSLLNAP